MSRCGIVILAAGASTRMGVAKQSLPLHGIPLLQRAVQTATAAGAGPIVVVLGARAHELQPILLGQPVQVVINPDWQSGMGTSIRAGIAALHGQPIDAAMIFLCDQPLISSAHLTQMIAAHFSAAKPMTAAFYAGTLGTPVIFSSTLFNALQNLNDAQGGKTLINQHPDQVQTFDLPEAAADVDTPADYRSLTSPA
jgi:molybdenum cofactor cytidylyltransferase